MLRMTTPYKLGTILGFVAAAIWQVVRIAVNVLFAATAFILLIDLAFADVGWARPVIIDVVDGESAVRAALSAVAAVFLVKLVSNSDSDASE